MLTRTCHETVAFHHHFSLKGVGRILPAGSYEVATDEELIEGLSFAAYRRIAAVMLAPTQSTRTPSIEMLTIGPVDLAAAVERDTMAVKGASVSERRL